MTLYFHQKAPQGTKGPYQAHRPPYGLLPDDQTAMIAAGQTSTCAGPGKWRTASPTSRGASPSTIGGPHERRKYAEDT